MKAIWTEEEPEYHGEFVNFDKMKQWPKPLQKPHPPIIVGGAFPYAARRAIRYGDGWIPRDDWLEKDGVGVVIDQFRKMATEAGRDPASLPISHLPRARQYRPAALLPGDRHRPRRLLPAGGEGGQDPADPRPLGRAEASTGRLTKGWKTWPAFVRAPYAGLTHHLAPHRAGGASTIDSNSFLIVRTWSNRHKTSPETAFVSVGDC